MQGIIRYQGAVISDDHILLIQHRHYANDRSYWLLPGGGLEGDETPEACVQREVREETHLACLGRVTLAGRSRYAWWNLSAPAYLRLPRSRRRCPARLRAGR